MTSFGYFKHNQQNWNLHNILEFKIQFKSKLILIQQLNKKYWIKSMCIEYIIYNFFYVHRVSCLWFIIHCPKK
jgi:hypothetical protein